MGARGRGSDDSGSAVWEKEAERTTPGEALPRYAEVITPEKKSVRQETNRINQLKRDPLAKRSLASIRGVDLSAYRNKRLKKCRRARCGSIWR